ncbi:MAG: alkane 1-monooxygenase [Rhodobacteraceae bacterium]|nr:alkane 1-monooxygenase [Paracoccaceae bacterium]
MSDTRTPSPAATSSLRAALPFWASLIILPMVALAATFGGWTLLLVPLASWWLFSILDLIIGIDRDSLDPETAEAELFWHRLITLIWPVLQFGLIFGTLAFVTQTTHLSGWEKIGLFFGVGVGSGTIGIVYAHELMHQRNRLERWLGDILMAMTQYGHYRSEHLLVHHAHVGTPRDAVTARYNEGFHRFFPRVLRQSAQSAWRVEAAMQARRGRSVWHLSNPFWRYWALQLAFLVLAFAIGGWVGLGLYAYQAFIAVWQLELVNYVEHYGLTREHLGEGRYERVKPYHSWNADFRASNWLLINLQRHADHHMKPDRRYPLLQTYSEDDVPTLPYGYPVMTALAMIPPLWRRFMNPRVRNWRRQHYPQISEWSAYNTGTNPMPARG